MKWVITSHVHYDRVASPWLIKRFVDKEAQFFFVDRDKLDQRPKDAIPVSIPGAKLGPHDEQGPTFLKIVKEYKLQDPALDQMAVIVAKGVEYVIHKFRPEKDDRFGQIAVGYLAFSDGMQLMTPGDQARLDASFIVWDALYALLKANKERG
jgi:hypothetical protein